MKNVLDLNALKGKLPPGVGGKQPMTLNIDVSKCPDMTCTTILPSGEVCGCPLFVDAFTMKYVSPLQSPTAKQTVAAMPARKMCVKCGQIFNPDQWMKDHNKKIEEDAKGNNP